MNANGRLLGQSRTTARISGRRSLGSPAAESLEWAIASRRGTKLPRVEFAKECRGLPCLMSFWQWLWRAREWRRRAKWRAEGVKKKGRYGGKLEKENMLKDDSGRKQGEEKTREEPKKGGTMEGVVTTEEVA